MIRFLHALKFENELDLVDSVELTFVVLSEMQYTKELDANRNRCTNMEFVARLVLLGHKVESFSLNKLL